MARPGRQAGIRGDKKTSAEGAAHIAGAFLTYWSLPTVAVILSTIINRFFRQDFCWICSAAMESDGMQDRFLPECRAFGARIIAYPLSRPDGRA